MKNWLTIATAILVKTRAHVGMVLIATIVPVQGASLVSLRGGALVALMFYCNETLCCWSSIVDDSKLSIVITKLFVCLGLVAGWLSWTGLWYSSSRSSEWLFDFFGDCMHFLPLCSNSWKYNGADQHGRWYSLRGPSWLAFLTVRSKESAGKQADQL